MKPQGTYTVAASVSNRQGINVLSNQAAVEIKFSNIARNNAINQIVYSIAMEDIALSRVLKTESDKLQYMLGTLRAEGNSNPKTEYVLSMTDSAIDMLQTANDMHMLTTRKLKKALRSYT